MEVREDTKLASKRILQANNPNKYMDTYEPQAGEVSQEAVDNFAEGEMERYQDIGEPRNPWGNLHPFASLIGRK